MYIPKKATAINNLFKNKMTKAIMMTQQNNLSFVLGTGTMESPITVAMKTVQLHIPGAIPTSPGTMLHVVMT